MLMYIDLLFQVPQEGPRFVVAVGRGPPQHPPAEEGVENATVQLTFTLHVTLQLVAHMHHFSCLQFTTLDGQADSQGDLKSVVLHDMKIVHSKSTFPMSLGEGQHPFPVRINSVFNPSLVPHIVDHRASPMLRRRQNYWRRRQDLLLHGRGIFDGPPPQLGVAHREEAAGGRRVARLRV